MSSLTVRPFVLVLGLALAGATIQGCAAPTRARLIAEPHCADMSLQIYFADKSAALSPAARRVIANAAAQAKGCMAADVDVVGLADYRGAPEPNLALSRQRAETVADALVKSGFPPPKFSVDAAGQAGAVTRQGQIEPLRRRADVFIRFAR